MLVKNQCQCLISSLQCFSKYLFTTYNMSDTTVCQDDPATQPYAAFLLLETYASVGVGGLGRNGSEVKPLNRQKENSI